MIIEKDPFRFFFPLGAILAIVGVLPWSFHIFGQPTYPVEFHRAIMMNGFTLSFVAGFLMTAIPRFTQAGFAKIYEVLIVGAAIILAAAFEFLSLQMYHHLAAAFALFSLVAFGFLRFRKRKANPPFTFVFVGLGLLLWTLSNFMIFWSLLTTGMRPDTFSIWGELFSNGALMSIVLGVGGRLIPGILGWQEIVTVQRQKYEGTDTFLRAVPALIWVLVFVYLASFLVQAMTSQTVSLALRAFVILVFAFKYWRIYRWPQDKSFLTWSLWASCWCFVIGSILNVVWTAAYVHSLHTMLVGGFSLLTVLVATRVTLAHGSVGREAEKTSYIIPVFTTLLLLATLTRVTAILMPAFYLNHLSYASLTWIAGFAIWVIFAIPRMWKVRD